jgi:hypothetical protein
MMPAAAVINISDPSALGLSSNDEFIQGIHVINTRNDFVMGGGYDSPDGFIHAAVNYLSGHIAVIGFKDLFGGGDLDFNGDMGESCRRHRYCSDTGALDHAIAQSFSA